GGGPGLGVRDLDALGHRVRDGLLADLRLVLGHRVRDLLDAGLLDVAGHLDRHLLDDRVRDLLADGVGHLLADGLLHVGRARHRRAHRPPHALLPGADLVGLLNLVAGPVAALVVGRAGARVEAALVRRLAPDALALAGHTVRLADRILDPAGDSLAGRHRPADRLVAGLVAGLDTVLVAGAADVLVARLAERPAGGAADVLVAGHAHRLAHGVAAVPVARLAHLLGVVAGGRVALRLADRLAHRAADDLLAALRDALADRVLAGLVARLVARLA